MSQRNVEMLIGRLLTDEELRCRFVRAPGETLADLCAKGYEFSRGEIDALLQIDTEVWTSGADRISSRLQRGSLRSE